MLEAIAGMLVDRKLINTQWYTDTYDQGRLIRLYREYYDGYHRLLLTTEMKAMLNITDDRLQRFNANYCELIIGSMADRLTVEKIEVRAKKTLADDAASQAAHLEKVNNETTAQSIERMKNAMFNPVASDKNASVMGQQWIDDLLDDNRFDALQIAVRESVLCDGETFIISEYDDDEQCIKWCHEPAWDSETGMVVIYERGSKTEIACAIKIWYDVPLTEAKIETDTRKDGTYMRANVYFADHTERYYSENGTDALPLVDEVSGSHIETTVRVNKAPGVPVVRFHNKNGVSELVNIVPLQDSLNSFLVDLVMSAQLTAFSIFFAVGVDVPQGITPGMVIRKNLVDANGQQIMPESPEDAQIHAAILAASRLERIQGGDLTQIMGAIDMIINQIAVISSTPMPNQMGGKSASGEALKQRDVRLLGKLSRAQVQMGNSWEDAILLANTQTTLFSGTTAPELDIINTRWKSAEIRNDADILAAATQLQLWGFEREALRMLSQSTLASYTEDDINRMMAEKNANTADILQRTMSNMNDHSNFNVPTSTPANPIQANQQPNGAQIPAKVPVLA